MPLTTLYYTLYLTVQKYWLIVFPQSSCFQLNMIFVSFISIYYTIIIFCVFHACINCTCSIYLQWENWAERSVPSLGIRRRSLGVSSPSQRILRFSFLKLASQNPSGWIISRKNAVDIFNAATGFKWYTYGVKCICNGKDGVKTAGKNWCQWHRCATRIVWKKMTLFPAIMMPPMPRPGEQRRWFHNEISTRGGDLDRAVWMRSCASNTTSECQLHNYCTTDMNKSCTCATARPMYNLWTRRIAHPVQIPCTHWNISLQDPWSQAHVHCAMMPGTWVLDTISQQSHTGHSSSFVNMV